MSHYLKSLNVKNFRSIIEENFILKEFTAFVGINNAGKSNIMKSIIWLLQGGKLTSASFFNTNIIITVEGVICGIDASLLLILPQNQRNALQPYLTNDELKIRRTQASNQKDILEVFDITNAGTPTEWRPTPTGLPQALSAIFPDSIVINAMDNCEEDVTKPKTSTTIGKLIAQIIQPMENTHGAKIEKILKKLNNLLDADSSNRASVLKEFDKTVSSKIKEFFPGVNLKLHIPTPEVKELMKQGTVKIFEDNFLQSRDFNSLGHGAQRAIQMALVRYLAESINQNVQIKTTTLLIIDEPELYLHPQAIEVLRLSLKRLSLNGYQIIFSTHSPLIIQANDIHDTLLIYKNKTSGTKNRGTLRTAITQVLPTALSQIELLFSLSNSSQILFADKVVLVEGTTEIRILPLLYNTISKKTLFQDKIALVDQRGSGSISKSFAVLQLLNIPSKAIVDLDYAFQNAIQNGYLTSTDSDLQQLLNILKTLSIKYRFSLNNGLPSKGGKIAAEEAYKLLGSKKIAKPYITNLHHKLLAHNIWLWTKGSIEKHLGLQQKNEQEWALYNKNLTTLPLKKAVKDLPNIKKLMRWINN